MLPKHTYYDELEAASLNKRLEYHNDRLRSIVVHAYANAPAFKKKMEEAGMLPSDIQSIDDLTKIPITSKEDLMKLQKTYPPFGGFLTVPIRQLKAVCMSPGPIYNTPGNDETYFRRVERSFFGCGLRPGDILLNTFSYHISPMGLLLDTTLKCFGATVIPMGGGNKQLQVQVIHDLQVTVFTGTASFLLEILQTAETMGFDPKKDFRLRLAITPLDHGLMKVIERDYGIRVTEFYGTADVGIVAYNCEERSGMHVCEDVILEIVDMNGDNRLEPGNVGKVVITTLDKTVPFIRYSPGDLSSWDDGICPCGRTSQKLNPISGWIGEAVKARGMFVHPSQLSSIASRYAGIGWYQLVCGIVNNKDHLTLKYEVTDSTLNREGMEESFRMSFRDICRLNLDDITCVPGGTLSKDGKVIVDERKMHAGE